MGDEATLLATKKRLEAAGVKVVGVTDHGFCESIYFFDPSGHRLELTVRTDEDLDPDELEKGAKSVLERWQQRKQRGELSAEPR